MIPNKLWDDNNKRQNSFKLFITAKPSSSFFCYCCGCFDESAKKVSMNNNNNTSNNSNNINRMKKLNIFNQRKSRVSDQLPATPAVDTLHRIVNAKEEVNVINSIKLHWLQLMFQLINFYFGHHMSTLYCLYRIGKSISL